MDLATFGAILSFALDFEERASEFYTGSAKGDLIRIERQLFFVGPIEQKVVFAHFEETVCAPFPDHPS